MGVSGGKPITLMGGGTTKVGDPSFRSDERPLLDNAAIDANIAGMQQVFEKYLSYGDGDSDAIMLNNAEWLDNLNYLEFLRDIGRHFSVNRMLSFESVKQRLERESPLSFLEFNYMILQAFDFLMLHRRLRVALLLQPARPAALVLARVRICRIRLRIRARRAQHCEQRIE